AARDNPYRLAVGLIGAEATLRLFPEQERCERAFVALTRFLDLLDELPDRPGTARARPARPRFPAQAALGRGLPAASRKLRRVWRGRPDRRLLRACRRRRLRRLRGDDRGARPLA